MTRATDAVDSYLNERTGCYEYRSVRYQRAVDALKYLGLADTETVVDIGAGWTEFDYCLRVNAGWRGRYIPVDMGIDNTDLNTWEPPRDYDYAVALEILEHLEDPERLIQLLQYACKGIVVSVPNPRTCDVLGMDDTHVTEVTRAMLERWDFQVQEATFYGGVYSNGEPDALFAVWTRS